ncbi:TPA: restriction endonuclease subunit S [Legionella pneumophila]|uniref:restriction endonuclease subunit S n=1 Tax=Legionella TaxID=445 RepID=UPI00105682A8|nr:MULTISPECIES: restriction endonuclease subunit S [Legionella]MCO1453715.1 restriction endonuclease subunit S [Legionella pneumophila]MDC8030495.1 restriction endonuclease subunit S [Legionella pneumophila subsp. pneumophila]MDI0458102.1 restriction endonuclease subunit S [Legionella pneumophila]MDI0462675.1 restriction endonuclease subunit S [Legionella pneumophila]MDI2025520.1 restriction endonuclease subunit S [Legionella pneumophila]
MRTKAASIAAWKKIRLKRAVTINNGKDYKSVESVDGYPVFGSGGVFAYSSEFLYNGEAILLGRKGTVDKPLYVNGAFWTVDTMFYAIPLRGYHAKFIFYCSQTIPFDQYQSDTAIPSMTQSVLNNHEFLVPDYKLQKEIADFLDRETDLINQLIEKKEAFLLKASKRIESLVDKAISCQRVPRIRFENVVQRMQRSVNLSEYDELIRLGLYNKGRGIFKKPAADEEGMGDSKFFFVEPGDLILSGQFAWEGAVALATSKEDGCVVSHRYPIYRGKGSVNTAYLFGLLRSNFGDFILNEASRGSAGRNRPLNTWRLGKEKIPIPEISLQEEIEQAVIFERRLREKTQRSIDILEEFRTSLITEAVTGQLDIKSWKKRGSTDERLDNIEESMQT